MTFDLFHSPIDTIRVCRVLEKLALGEFALTGSLALETHLIANQLGAGGQKRFTIFADKPFHTVQSVLFFA